MSKQAFDVRTFVANVTADAVTMADLQHLKTIWIVGQSETIASVLSLPDSNWFVRLVSSSKCWGWLSKTSKEIGDLFKDKGAYTEKMNLNSVKDCDVIIDNQNNRFWVLGGKLIPLYSQDGGLAMQHEGQYYSPVDLYRATNHLESSKQEYVFGQYFGVSARKALGNIVYLDKNKALQFVKKNDYVLQYYKNRAYTTQVISAADFKDHCTTDADAASKDPQYFVNKLPVIYDHTSSDFGKMSEVYQLLLDIANGRKPADLDYIPNFFARAKNKLGNAIGFTALKTNETKISGSYRYLDCGTVNDGFCEIADFEIALDSAGEILAATVTTKGRILLSYTKGQPMKA